MIGQPHTGSAWLRHLWHDELAAQTLEALDYAETAYRNATKLGALAGVTDLLKDAYDTLAKARILIDESRPVVPKQGKR